MHPQFRHQTARAPTIVSSGVLLGIRARRFFWQALVWAAVGAAGIVALALVLVSPDGRVHVYALDVGTGSALLIRTPNGHQVLIDEGPDSDKFAQAVGRALAPTARAIDVWLITGGRRSDIGAGAAALNRFQIGAIVIADPDAWAASLRALVQQAEADGIAVTATNGIFAVDGVGFMLAGDGRTRPDPAASRSWSPKRRGHRCRPVSTARFLSMEVRRNGKTGSGLQRDPSRLQQPRWITGAPIHRGLERGANLSD